MFPQECAPAREEKMSGKGPRWLIASFIFIAVTMVYLATACPSIAWWDSPEYTAAAYVFGVPNPPGSVFLVLVGRLFAMLPRFHEPAFNLTVMTILFGGMTAVLVYRSVLLLTESWAEGGIAAHGSAVLCALTVPFLDSVWDKATQTNPYTLSLFFSALIVGVALGWVKEATDKHGDRYLLLLAYLFGVDLGVHRGNVLLIPAIVLLVLLVKPHVFAQWKYGVLAPVLFVLGVSTHLVLIVRSGLNPALDLQSPETVASFWNYFSLRQYGTGPFLMGLLPRRAPLWAYQIKEMYLRYFGWNFIGRGPEDMTFSLRGLFALPFVVGLLGFASHVAKDWKKALFLFIAFLLMSFGVILYVNVPAGFFREIHRLFLASFLIFALWIGIGSAFLLRSVSKSKAATGVALLILILVLPANTVRSNLYRNNRADNYFAYDYASNLLQTCEPGTILFTQGNNDTLPLWYLQIVEGIRRDVKVVNLSLLNTLWFVHQLAERYPDFPISFSKEAITKLAPIPWEEKPLEIPGPEDGQGLSLTLAPTLAGKALRVQEQVVVDILRTNRWNLPVYFATTVAPDNLLGLSNYLRVDGLAYRLIPVKEAKMVPKVVEENLLQKYRYRSLRDYHCHVDDVTLNLFSNYRSVFLRLAWDYLRQCEKEKARRTLNAMRDRLPEDRLPFSHPGLAEAVKKLYEEAASSKEP